MSKWQEVFNRDPLRPERLISVSEWADKYRWLTSKGAAEPGKWRTDRVPYLKEIMDCLGPLSPIERVVFKKGSQIGGTECGNCWIAYTISQCPSTFLCVLPSGSSAQEFSKERLDPLFLDNPEVAKRIQESKQSRKSTILHKEYPGGVLSVVSAKSGASLRSKSIRFLMMDEVDAYGSILGEGDPVGLAEARTRAFPRRKIFYISTPTIEGASRIDDLFQKSDMRYYNVPCPYCQTYQVLKWENVKWPEGKPEKALYMCESPNCSHPEIEEWHKKEMLMNGKWIPTHPEIGNGKIAGFHLSSLYSPPGMFSWGEAAVKWTNAQSGIDGKRDFVNTYLGECWKGAGESPDFERLYRENREPYPPDEIPPKVLLLTCGVDVQNDRIEYEVLGHTDNLETYSINYKVVFGNPTGTELWEHLDDLLQKTWNHPCGAALGIMVLLIDSGAHTHIVYDWARKYSKKRVIATKGVDRDDIPVSQPKTVDINLPGKPIKNGVTIRKVAQNLFKDQLYGLLNLKKPMNPGDPFPKGYCHFPEYDLNYFRQLTAEKLILKIKNGKRTYVWDNEKRRNEALDCRVLNMAAAYLWGLPGYKKENWDYIKEELGIPVVAEKS